MATTETICPICFEVFPPSSTNHRTCPHCDSEAIEVDVQPIAAFMAGNSLADLETLLHRWEQASGFLPEYQAAKAGRIRKIIRRKRLAEGG